VLFGTGGQDSKIFTAQLTDAYLRYAASIGLSHTKLHVSAGNSVIKFSGKDAWKAFQHESGKHTVQRIPPTEKRGRAQTSVVSVAVLPLLDESYSPLPKSEIETKTQGGHGKGGQHQNARDSAVRMKHVPTGISVFINGRKQGQNKKEALKVLTAKVNDHKANERRRNYAQNRKGQIQGGSRSGKIRTYNFMKSRVVDHRTGKKTKNIAAVMKGRFDLIN